MRRRGSTAALIAVGIAVHTLPLGAQTVYKWVDADGGVHYSDQRPAGREVTEVELPEFTRYKPPATPAAATPATPTPAAPPGASGPAVAPTAAPLP